MSWRRALRLGISPALAVGCAGTAAWAAVVSDPGVTLSLATLDHLAAIVEALVAAAVACGGLVVWIIKTRTARSALVSQEIAMAVERERAEREEDVKNLEQGIAKLSGDFENLRSTCARAEDVKNLYRLVEKTADRSDTQHQLLRDQVTTLLGGMSTRLDRIAERRGAARENE